MKTDQSIQRYGRLMLRDLGSNPTYEWKWSEDLIHVMAAVTQGDGKPIMDAKLRGSIYVVEQAKTTRKIAPDLVNQWVVCALIELNSEDGRVNGTGIAAWIPVRDRRSRAVGLPPNQHPNQSDTESFIRQVRQFRAKKAAEMDAELIASMERAEHHRLDRYTDAFKDGFTAFGEIPGKKGGTSFPTPGPLLVQ